ncbi:MAG: hypothetical protein M3416_15685 [Acidobacteriota bacterium]|nr:hypothetical protein [Acidobacteriota bacterium]
MNRIGALITFAIALISCIAAVVVVPEVRQWLGWEIGRTDRPDSNTRRDLLDSPAAPTPTSRPISDPPPSIPAKSAVAFTITNQLGPTQVSEDVQVYIKGELVANLMVNQDAPTASAEVEVPRSGRYAYTLIADGVFEQFGLLQRAQGRGDGVIEVEEGGVFTLTLTPHGIRLVPQ